MSEPKLTPITPERAARELEKLATARNNGELKESEFDQRFARMIGELRDRGIGGTRAEIMAALEPLRLNKTVQPADWNRFVSQLGLG